MNTLQLLKCACFRLQAAMLPVCAGFAFLGGHAQAKAPIPQNLAGGLDTLVQSRLKFKRAKAAGRKPETFASANGVKYGTLRAARLADRSLSQEDGRVMVLVRLNGLESFKKVRRSIRSKIDGMTITAVDKHFKAGVLEGWIDVDDVPALARTWGVASVTLEARPQVSRTRREAASPTPNAVNGQQFTLLGTAFDQGVIQHGVDAINRFYNPSAALDYEGAGISVGFISDSFAASSNPITAEVDVANNDLPGSAANPVNQQPVVVLEDLDQGMGGTDEGRAMVQIGYKMAPKSRVAFATAYDGEIGFANNIRALAGLQGFTFPAEVQQGFAADVICDDVSYDGEPFFEDGIIANAVDEVAAAGVSYFASAGNDIGTYDYDSDFRFVPAGTGMTAADGNAALAHTNINLTGVPAGLYAGGFHNFNPAPGQQDVALTYNLNAPLASPTGLELPATNFQWTDPFNETLNFDSTPIYTAAGTSDGVTATPSSFTTPTLTAGQNYVIIESADAGSDFDGIITVTDPNGVVVVDAQDTNADEVVSLYPTVTGAYTISIEPFTPDVGVLPGAFHVNVYLGFNPLISTDFNLLAFDLEGNYLPDSSLASNNLAYNVPIEYGVTAPLGATDTSAGEGAVQYVVTRSAIPTQPHPANHFRILIRGNGLSGIGPAEYLTYNTPNIGGHRMARGGNGAAAYSVFRPNLPEYFSSPGPATVYFDNVGTRLETPEVRLQPSVAAADNANTSFFARESAADPDVKLNFPGTSAAAPHAAAIAALVIEAHGGPGTVTPAQMTEILHRTAFPHDLDPNFASGSARTTAGGKVTITINSDLGLNPSAGAFNPDSIAVAYTGAGALTSLTFNPQGLASTAGNPTGGNNGVDAALTSPVTYFSNLYPGIVFEPDETPFTLGTLTGLTSADITQPPAFTNQAPAPSVAGQVWTMGLTFPTNNFTGGKVLRFTVGHGLQHNSTVTGLTPGTGPSGGETSTSFTQADLFGGTVLLPDGTGPGAGMEFSGTTTGDGTFTGTLVNRYGSGYSVVDGFGFINAAAAVSAPLP